MCVVDFLRDMLKYTASVRDWMSADPKNIIAIHCKGGKGGVKDWFWYLTVSGYLLPNVNPTAALHRTHWDNGVHVAH